MKTVGHLFALSLGALLLAATTAFAQDPLPDAPAEPPPDFPGPAIIPQYASVPNLWIAGDWLYTFRGSSSGGVHSVIAGPDATSFNNLANFSNDAGFRIAGGIRLGDWFLEGAYADYGGWNSSTQQSIGGVSFDNGVNGGAWNGRNAINANTLFSPIYYAATYNGLVNSTLQQYGLSPNTSFPNDTKPSLLMTYHSELQLGEINFKPVDPFLVGWGRGMRLGAGYANASLAESSSATLSGTFRTQQVGAGANGILSNTALTSPQGGGLTLISGPGSGFNDGTADASVVPSTLVFTHQAWTNNQLNGAQLVLDGNLLEFRHLDLDFGLRGGIFDNYATASVVETYAETNRELAVYGRNLQDAGHNVAFLGSVRLDLAYHFGGHLELRGGYEVLFLSGVALAEDQGAGLQGSLYHVQTDGSAVIHGAHLGLELAF